MFFVMKKGTGNPNGNCSPGFLPLCCRFFMFFCNFHYWLWISKWRLGKVSVEYFSVKLLQKFLSFCMSFFNKHEVTALKNFMNPFHANVPFLYTLKTSENHRFADFFRGFRNGTLTQNGLRPLFWHFAMSQ